MFPFQKVLPVLLRSDLLFGNLECAHSVVGLKQSNLSSVQMRGDVQHISALAKAGFKVVNVANNHSTQHGPDAFLDTVKQLESHGIACCGVAADAQAAHAKPAVLVVNGLTVGFLGYSLRPRQYFDHVPPYAEGKAESMLQDVRTLRKQVHIVVVSMHWGEEFIQRPSPEEIKIAHLLVEEGADLIIGHHPHVLRGIERYGKGWIVYSLGNFICDMIWDDALRTSMIFECLLTKDGAKDIRNTVTYLNNEYQPEIVEGEKLQEVQSRLDRLALEIQNISFTESDMAKATYDYLLEASAVHRHIRSKSHRFFLSRFLRCPPLILCQQLTTYVRNRVHERLTPAGCC
jgi:poly-gamma-glutamate synthesis protein (capsule biosynthesis protein)